MVGDECLASLCAWYSKMDAFVTLVQMAQHRKAVFVSAFNAALLLFVLHSTPEPKHNSLLVIFRCIYYSSAV